MIPVTHRNFSASLVVGFAKTEDGRDRLDTESLGSVIAFDPESHIAITVGLTREMATRLDNYYLTEGSGFFPKWAGFKRMKRCELLASYREWLEQSHSPMRALP